MAKQVANVDTLVKDALLKIAAADGPLRLSGRGDAPPVFPSAAGANKEAINQLQKSDDPLVAVVGSGRVATVRFTPLGFARVIDLAPDTAHEITFRQLKNQSADERAEFRSALVSRAAGPDGKLFSAALTAVEQFEEELAAVATQQRREASVALYRGMFQSATARADRLEREANEAREEARRLEELIGVVAQPALPPDAVTSTTREPAPPVSQIKTAAVLIPETPEDRDFRRQIARRVISGWIDAWNDSRPEARQYIETSIWNMTGFRQIGEPGEQVSFDGELHDGPAGAFPGDQVRIVRPGWALEEDEDREYVVSKAVVTT